MYFVLFFCKQNTAYDMRISDWSSDVCSSDLLVHCSSNTLFPPFIVRQTLSMFVLPVVTPRTANWIHDRIAVYTHKKYERISVALFCCEHVHISVCCHIAITCALRRRSI